MPYQVPSNLEQTSTQATQNSHTKHHCSHIQDGVLYLTFQASPQDAWIDQLDEYGITSQPQLTTHYHCSFSAMEHSLPRFDPGKFDSLPLEEPLWIARFKSIVRDQPFLNDSHCH